MPDCFLCYWCNPGVATSSRQFRKIQLAEKPKPSGNPPSTPDPFALVAKIKTRGPAPVHLWDPPYCGDIDLVIKRDGSWVHEGKPIRRPAMLQLFASVLKLEGDKYFLVTPVEKVGIQVEDCPFIVTTMEAEQTEQGQRLRFGTNTGESLIANAEHELSFAEDENGEPHPTLHIRNGLRGLLTRAVFYRLVELAEPARVEKGAVENLETDAGKDAGKEAGNDLLGVRSDGAFFVLGRVP